jgi:hypothetical protein
MLVNIPPLQPHLKGNIDKEYESQGVSIYRGVFLLGYSEYCRLAQDTEVIVSLKNDKEDKHPIK